MTHNIADLSQAEQDQIELDKQCFYRARALLMNHSNDYIREELKTLSEPERSNLADKLNKLRKTYRSY